MELLHTVEKWVFVLLRAAALICIVALAMLALLPAGSVTRTDLGGDAEHFVAYMGTALLMGLAFRNNPPFAIQSGLLMTYATLLEAGQIYSPSRHASLHDLAFSVAGVAMGALVAWTACKRMSSRAKCTPISSE
jgi:VanZ family protein